MQYADYTLWKQELLGAADDPDSLFARQLAFWRDALDGAPEQIELPTDRPRPAMESHRGAIHRFTLPAPLRDRLRALAHSRQATLFMALQAGLAALFATLGAGRDIVLGTPVAGRGDEAADDLVGFFVNTLALRTDLGGDPTFEELLDRVRDADLSAFAHQDIPFEQLVEALNPTRSLARHPVFQVLLALQNNERGEAVMPGLEVTVERPTQAAAKYDLFVNLVESRNEDDGATAVEGAVEYATDLFDARTVARLTERYHDLLLAAVEEPTTRLSRMPVLNAAERGGLAAEWDAAAAGPAEDLVGLFRARAAETPDAVAVRCGGDSLTYAQLDERSCRVAAALAGHGAGPESRVAVCLPRTADLVVALLGVLRAGAAYVPLDPEYPDERIAAILADTRPAALLTTADCRPAITGAATATGGAVLLAADAAHGAGTMPEAFAAPPDQAAYVLHTSGSTGRPKGVVVSRGNLANLLADMRDRLRPTADDRLVAVTTVSFDIAALELFLPLVSGAGLVLADRDAARDPEALAALLTASGATILQATPTTWQLLAETAPDALRGLRKLVGGEALPPPWPPDCATWAANSSTSTGPPRPPSGPPPPTSTGSPGARRPSAGRCAPPAPTCWTSG